MTRSLNERPQELNVACLEAFGFSFFFLQVSVWEQKTWNIVTRLCIKIVYGQSPGAILLLVFFFGSFFFGPGSTWCHQLERTQLGRCTSKERWNPVGFQWPWSEGTTMMSSKDDVGSSFVGFWYWNENLKKIRIDFFFKKQCGAPGDEVRRRPEPVDVESVVARLGGSAESGIRKRHAFAQLQRLLFVVVGLRRRCRSSFVSSLFSFVFFVKWTSDSDGFPFFF